MATPATPPPNYVIPAIAASATVIASIIGGFGAALLKHRWDVEDDQRRWNRERAERRREELRTAFNQYLSARGVQVIAFSLHDPIPKLEEINAASIAMFATLQAFNQLTTLLEDEDLGPVAYDSNSLAKWTDARHEGWKGNSSVEVPKLPSDEPVRQLAKRLLDT